MGAPAIWSRRSLTGEMERERSRSRAGRAGASARRGCGSGDGDRSRPRGGGASARFPPLSLRTGPRFTIIASVSSSSPSDEDECASFAFSFAFFFFFSFFCFFFFLKVRRTCFGVAHNWPCSVLSVCFLHFFQLQIPTFSPWPFHCPVHRQNYNKENIGTCQFGFHRRFNFCCF